ncbi:MAG: ADP-ribosylation factor-directed GTPase activating protein isoform b [Planctomycetia bacterium]
MMRFLSRSAIRPFRDVPLGFLTGALLVGALGCGRPSTPTGSTEPSSESRSATVDRASLCRRIDAVLAHARDGRLLDASVHGAWQVVHGILAFGRDFPLAHDGEVSPALDFLLGGGRITGWELRPASPGVRAIVEGGSTMAQGHPDQWLGYLSQCGLAPCGRGGVPLDARLVVNGRDLTVADLLSQAQADIAPGQEATWTLMAFSSYLPHEATWKARNGRTWSIGDVVAMEAAADIFSSACGGAHRLYGLITAVRQRMAATGQSWGELDGPWAEAAGVIDDAVDRARRFQQDDGSFSTHSFERPGHSTDVFATLGATGHVFEVVVMALDDERLTERWVARAADRLVTLLEQTADIEVECGALYHAAHGLAIYRERLCQDRNPASDRGAP